MYVQVCILYETSESHTQSLKRIVYQLNYFRTVVRFSFFTYKIWNIFWNCDFNREENVAVFRVFMFWLSALAFSIHIEWKWQNASADDNMTKFVWIFFCCCHKWQKACVSEWNTSFSKANFSYFFCHQNFLLDTLSIINDTMKYYLQREYGHFCFLQKSENFAFYPEIVVSLVYTILLVLIINCPPEHLVRALVHATVFW